MLSCYNKSRERYKQFWHFSINKKVQLPAMRITEQPILLTKRKIVWVINFQSIFVKNGQSNLIFVLVLVLESKRSLTLNLGRQKTAAFVHD